MYTDQEERSLLHDEVVRLTRVETAQEALHASVLKLSNDFGAFRTDVQTLFNRLSEQFAAGRVTNWGPIFTAGALVLGICSTVGYMALQPMTSGIEANKLTLDNVINQRFDTVVTHREADQQSQLYLQRLRALESHIERLEKEVEVINGAQFTQKDYENYVNPRLTQVEESLFHSQ